MFFFNKIKHDEHLGSKKILLIADKRGWAYDSIAKSLIKYNNDSDLILSLNYIKNNNFNLKKEWKKYDLIFFMGWQLLFDFNGKKIKEKYNYIDKNKIITGVHSHRSWDNGKTKPGYFPLPDSVLVNHLNKYAGINFVSRRLYQIFLEAGLKNSACTLNGVDTEIFRPQDKNKILSSKLTIGFSGAFKHDELKGLSKYIVPAVELLDDVELKVAISEDGNHLDYSNMPDYYNSIDIYICASSSEGFSLSVLEASACGVPILSTRVGGNEDLIVDRINGYYIDRSVEDISTKINKLKSTKDIIEQYGKNNRSIVEQFWSWKIRVKCWIAFIKLHT